MITRTLRRALTTLAALTVLALPALCGAAGATTPDPDRPTPPQVSSTGQEPVFDDGTWTIETMLAVRHAQLTPTWWEALF
ncbi:hypothetical protein GCM10009798_40810 [Nocardioides panacihumi]|uniref:Uncharacterized protein n=1 Tax=Nocardioides panacihumi TaxID=400774 RepID=A0ABN2RV15_9ACTN